MSKLRASGGTRDGAFASTRSSSTSTFVERTSSVMVSVYSPHAKAARPGICRVADCRRFEAIACRTSEALAREFD